MLVDGGSEHGVLQALQGLSRLELSQEVGGAEHITGFTVCIEGRGLLLAL